MRCGFAAFLTLRNPEINLEPASGHAAKRFYCKRQGGAQGFCRRIKKGWTTKKMPPTGEQHGRRSDCRNSLGWLGIQKMI